jgi:hypothetical protein
MSKASEKMIKRQVVMADGRYLIFYTFAPFDRPASSDRADPVPEAKSAKPAEEN